MTPPPILGMFLSIKSNLILRQIRCIIYLFLYIIPFEFKILYETVNDAIARTLEWNLKFVMTKDLWSWKGTWCLVWHLGNLTEKLDETLFIALTGFCAVLIFSPGHRHQPITTTYQRFVMGLPWGSLICFLLIVMFWTRLYRPYSNLIPDLLIPFFYFRIHALFVNQHCMTSLTGNILLPL